MQACRLSRRLVREVSLAAKSAKSKTREVQEKKKDRMEREGWGAALLSKAKSQERGCRDGIHGNDMALKRKDVWGVKMEVTAALVGIDFEFQCIGWSRSVTRRNM